MIGGGDVDFKSLMECDAVGIEPSHPGSPCVRVLKEVDYKGNFVKDATLRIVTLDAGEPDTALLGSAEVSSGSR